MSDIPPPLKSENEERLLALVSHLSPLIGVGLLAPIIIMVIKKDSPFVQDQSKEALNFQLTMLLASLVTCGIGVIVCVPMLLIFGIIGGLAAHNGTVYRYPFVFRMIQ